MDCGAKVSEDGKNAHMHCGVAAGDATLGARGGVFAAGNTSGGPVTTGVYGGMNANGHALSVEHSRTHGQGTATTAAAQAMLLQNSNHALNANASYSHIQPAQGGNFDKIGGGLGWQSAGGHGASVGVNHIPQFNMTSAQVAGQANLWSSPNGASSLDATVNASRHLSGPFQGQKDFGAGLMFKHKF